MKCIGFAGGGIQNSIRDEFRKRKNQDLVKI